jgi:DNA polymerase-3 subunit epsilon
MKGKKLKIKKPLIVFDLETTGLNPRADRIVEICVIKKYPPSKSKGSRKKKDEVKTRLINPGMAIPEEVSKIHGITDAKVKGAPKFAQVAKGLASFIEGCDVVGYNSNRFDVPFLLAEFERAGVMDAFKDVEFIDVFNLFSHFNPRTLEAAYASYCGKKLVAHKAENDARATFEVLEGIINEHHGEIEDESVSGLAELSKRKKGLDILGVVVQSERGPVFSIGKNKGQLVTADKSYCDWIINVSDFSENTKNVVRMILKGKA